MRDCLGTTQCESPATFIICKNNQRCCTCTCVTELSDVQMCGLVADGIVEHTAVGVFILIFHLQM